jgi:hypothetical protein
MSPTRPGCMFVLLVSIVLFLGSVVATVARPVKRGHVKVRGVGRHHKPVVKRFGKRRVAGKRRLVVKRRLAGKRRPPRKPKSHLAVVRPVPATAVAPKKQPVAARLPEAGLKPMPVPSTTPEPQPKPVPVPKAKPVHMSKSELVARGIDAAVAHSHEIVKMLKTGTDRGGVYLAYVPAKGPKPTPSKLICEIDLSTKDVIDEYYYSAGHLIFVRETVRNYPVDTRTKAIDFEHPTYKEPVAIPFVRGHIAGSAKLRKRERSLLFDSKYLLTLLHAKGNPVDVEHWVKSPQI